ncbi:hypothetical protein N7462_007255 [Penicillium macrosclerotiorum]|uniref:uncharacterized protein n=1 Tax=Penicillium macrosclerotiorum TaxID=303699 RepID=UPI0025467967|nr:uncharacterized protein N7462_007255 [Penicillium macrosclerotiorum]KAJ5679011.1 hypothetical protein N7462_007255 [Penicillium macrosclerotiorum]
MDLIPPSYKSATDRDAWAIIARYIPSSDLCATSLVCHRWHDLFMPFLWGDPASHFGTDNDAVYVALTRFRRTLKYSRQEVRALTHTLHLPPALSEIYGGPRPGWLRDILEYLPCLQCLMVSRLPFFDHNAMAALRQETQSSQYNVRLLLADHEPNTTSAGLAETLLRFPLLTYLDLSYTKSARDRSVLSSLSQLEHLQVLKLRDIGLRDNDAEFLANAIVIRVRYLDLRNNNLTDMAVRSLLQASFITKSHPEIPRTRRTGSSPDPVSQAAARHSSNSDLLQSPQLDEHFIKILAQPASNHSWTEDLPHSGITHLYIANNQITVEGVAGLLASSRLHALDAGTVNTVDMIHKTASKHGRYPGAEKLVPILGNVAGEKLAYLRAHHAVLTAEPPSKDVASSVDFLPELPASNEVPREAELDASDEARVHELPSENIPVFELADTSITDTKTSFTVTTPTPCPSNPYEDEPLPAVRRGSAFAPEVIPSHECDPHSPVFTINGSIPSHTWPSENEATLQSISNSSSFNDILGAAISQCNSPISIDDARAQKIQELLSKRPRNQSIPRRAGKEICFPYLHPSHIPHLETLVLTDVPSHIPPNSPILHTLTRFLTACSNEALLATLQAGSDYSLPPGQARMRAEHQRSRSLFGLRRIILEVTPIDRSARLTSWKPSLQTSSTGDRDSEALWAAAADDYSFFGEEECGVPENDPGKYFPMAVLNEKVSLMPSDDDASTHSGGESPLPGRDFSRRSVTSAARGTPSPSRTAADSQPQRMLQEVDLVAELAAFRRSKKAEYEQVVRRERKRRSTNGSGISHAFTATTPQLSMAHFVEGHWKGEVKIVRNPTPNARSGMVDMYGNYFEKGYLYP